MGLMEKLVGAKETGSASKASLTFNMSDAGVLIPDAGKALLVAVRVGSTNNIDTTQGSNGVTDTAGGAWEVVGGSNAYASGANCYLLVCHDVPAYASTDSLTFNFTKANPYTSAVVGQWPAGVFAAVDGTVQAATNSAGAQRNAPSLTPTQAGEELITAFACGQTTSGAVTLQSGSSALTLLGATTNCGLAEITTPEPGPTFTPVSCGWQQTQAGGSSALSVLFLASTVVSADAGADQVVGLGETVTLRATITGADATASWVCTDGPDAGATLTGVSPAYAAAAIGEDTWELTATDGDANTATDTMTVNCAANIVLVCTGSSIRKVRSVTVKPDGTAS